MSTAHYTKIDATVIFTTANQNKLAGIAAGAQVNRAIASQAAAEAGTSNSAVMTPQRTTQFRNARYRVITTDPTITLTVMPFGTAA